MISDYEAVTQLRGHASFESALASSLNAGVDVVMTHGGLHAGGPPLSQQLAIWKSILDKMQRDERETALEELLKVLTNQSISPD